MGVEFLLPSLLRNLVRRLMRHRRRSHTKSLSVVVLMAAMLTVGAAKDMQVSDLVKKNLDSVGNEQARAAVKSRVAQGALHFVYISGGVGVQDGKETSVGVRAR